MLKIRLSRRGKKKQPTYRVIVADAESKRDGRYVELIGWYNPLTNPESYRIDEGRALYWLSVGAQPTDAVKRLLATQGTYDRLSRVHQGEGIEALVAEYEGRPVEPEVETAAEETIEETAEEAPGLIERIVDTVENAAEAVVEFVAGDDEAEEEAATATEETVVAAETDEDDEDKDEA